MKGQLTGMAGVYLVAAELSRRGFIASPTSRSARGADILVTDQACRNSFSVQVKTNAKPSSFWLVGKHVAVAKSHIYVLVNLRPLAAPGATAYFVLPSAILKKRVACYRRPNSEWWAVRRGDILKYQDRWEVCGDAAARSRASRTTPARRASAGSKRSRRA